MKADAHHTHTRTHTHTPQEVTAIHKHTHTPQEEIKAMKADRERERARTHTHAPQEEVKAMKAEMTHVQDMRVQVPFLCQKRFTIEVKEMY
jgi:hypothetical protein